MWQQRDVKSSYISLKAVFHNTQYDYDDVIDLPELTISRLHPQPEHFIQNSGGNRCVGLQ